MARRSRRAVLAALATSLGATAGCSEESSDTTTTRRPTTSAPRPTTTTDPEPQLPTTGPPTGGVQAFDEVLPPFMNDWNIPGASVAASQNGRLVFARGYGLADGETGDLVQPDSLFRVGSISKPITAVTVLDLVERGQLSLDDRAFDIRSDLLPEEGPADPRVEEITVRQLLRHTAGWSNRQVGFDPMFAPKRIAEETDTEPPASAETTIRFMLGQDLGFDPGTRFQYSNFGYCVLGRVIEAVTGREYEAHVQERVLDPLGAERMQIGATRQAGRLDDEVRYHGHRTAESPFPDQGEVPRPYAAAHLQTQDANGGWIASPIDILRFVRGVDGDDAVPDVLDPETIETMTARPPIDTWQDSSQYYAMGWLVTAHPRGLVIGHNGSLPGSHGLFIYDRAADLAVAALFNARAPDPQFRRFQSAVGQLLTNAYRAVDEWPDRDLFGEFD